MSTHPTDCPECGIQSGRYSSGCRNCRRRANRADAQRRRRTGTRHARIVIEGGPAADLRRAVSALEAAYETYREDLPARFAFTAGRALELLDQAIRSRPEPPGGGSHPLSVT